MLMKGMHLLQDWLTSLCPHGPLRRIWFRSAASHNEDHVQAAGTSRQRDARLNQSWPFVGCGILGTARSAAVVPDPYGLQACNADDTTSFDNHPSFHSASLDRPPGGDNALFGEGTNLL
jgi:hypothetical protein